MRQQLQAQDRQSKEAQAAEILAAVRRLRIACTDAIAAHELERKDAAEIERIRNSQETFSALVASAPHQIPDPVVVQAM